jgi:AcrR family transcriptional regulator
MNALAVEAPRRLSREEKRHQTRERLRESAARAVGAQGVLGASVDTISESAGYSRGAFYGNYETKEELLLEMIVEMMGREAQAWEQLVASSPDLDAMLAELEKRIAARTRESQWSALSLELQLHAQRNPAFGRSYVALLRQHTVRAAALFEAIFRKAGRVPPDDPRSLAAAAMALGNGVAVQAACGLRPGDTRYAARSFMLYLRGLLAIAQPAGDGAARRPSTKSR